MVRLDTTLQSPLDIEEISCPLWVQKTYKHIQTTYNKEVFVFPENFVFKDTEWHLEKLVLNLFAH